MEDTNKAVLSFFRWELGYKKYKYKGQDQWKTRYNRKAFQQPLSIVDVRRKLKISKQIANLKSPSTNFDQIHIYVACHPTTVETAQFFQVHAEQVSK